MKENLRGVLGEKLPNVRFSFEPADIVSEVMSFGSATPIEISARSANLNENRKFIAKVQNELAQIPALRDVQVSQSLDYPTINVNVDREKAGISGVTVSQVTKSVVAATSSSRFVVPIFWPDPKRGIGYLVQVEIPQPAMKSLDDLATVPVSRAGEKQILLRDVGHVTSGTMPGQYDRYNMKREVTLGANLAGADLGTVARQVSRVATEVQRRDDEEKDGLEKRGEKPVRVTHELRGQIPPLRQILSGLSVGLALAIVVIFLLLTATFQSPRLAFIAVSTTPAVLSGVVLALFCTGTTINIQSFIGAIMAIGVAMANAILFVAFAEQHRREGAAAPTAATVGGSMRLRAIVMTSGAMIAGMIRMALGHGEAGQQSAPLGRAVIGGLLAATPATLLMLPAMFAFIQRRSSTKSASLDPDDPESARYAPLDITQGTTS